MYIEKGHLVMKNNGMLILFLALITSISIQRPALLLVILVASIGSAYFIHDDQIVDEISEKTNQDPEKTAATSARASVNNNSSSDNPTEPRRATANNTLNNDEDKTEENEPNPQNTIMQNKPQPPITGAQMQQRLDELMLSRARALRDITHPPRERLDRMLDKAFDELEKTRTRRDIYTVLEEEDSNEICNTRLPSA